MPLGEKYECNYSPSSYWKRVGQTGLFNLGMLTGLREEKLNLKKGKFCFRIYIESHPARGGGLDKYWFGYLF